MGALGRQLSPLTPSVHLRNPFRGASGSANSLQLRQSNRRQLAVECVRAASNVKQRTVKGQKGQTQKGKTQKGTRKTQSKSLPKSPAPEQKGGRWYFNFTGFPFPLGPITRRTTIRYEVVPGTIWCFEQQQALAFSNVTTNIRMTAVLLQSGELLIYAPVAPTRECIELVKELGYPVGYLILPTFAYEHKIFMAPFSRKFPDAEVYTSPRQWSWPLPLPQQLLGIFPKGTLEDNDESTPWAAELKQKVFSSSVGFGPYTEVAFYHVRSRTLLVTDAVISIPSQPPEVVPEWALQDAGGKLPGPVLAFCSGGEEEIPPPPEDPKVRRRLGWMRMALQILYFVPFNLVRPEGSFRAVAQQLLVSPVVKTLVFTKASRDEVRAWVDSICRDWDFRQIIPAHFDAPVPAKPQDFRAAFSFLYGDEPLPEEPKGLLAGLFKTISGGKRGQVVFPPEDMRGLNAIENALKKANVINKT